MIGMVTRHLGMVARHLGMGCGWRMNGARDER